MSVGRPAQRPPADTEFGLFTNFFNWIVRRLVRLAVSRWYGFIVVIFAGIGFGLLAAAVYTVFPTGRRVGRIAFYLAFGAWLCLGLLFGLVRHAVRKPGVDWRELTAIGRFDRVLITIVGTAVFGAPMVWLVWRIIAN